MNLPQLTPVTRVVLLEEWTAMSEDAVLVNFADRRDWKTDARDDDEWFL